MRRTAHLVCLLLMALILTMVPLPMPLNGMAPAWVVLWVLYVQFFLPFLFRLSAVVFLGLFLDVMCFSVLGEHVFAMMLACLIASYASRRFIFFTSIQQMFWVALCCVGYQLGLDLIELLQGIHPSVLGSVFSVLLSTLLWPWLCLVAPTYATQKSAHLDSRYF